MTVNLGAAEAHGESEASAGRSSIPGQVTANSSHSEGPVTITFISRRRSALLLRLATIVGTNAREAELARFIGIPSSPIRPAAPLLPALAQKIHAFIITP